MLCLTKYDKSKTALQYKQAGQFYRPADRQLIVSIAGRLFYYLGGNENGSFDSTP